MSTLSDYTNELKTAEAFSKQAPVFDKQYAGNTIIKYKRQRVRQHVMELLPEPCSILELNSGTGEDALFFAGRGYTVHATDISGGMQIRLQEKLTGTAYGDKVTFEQCSFNQLSQLNKKGPYDLLFSNFGGLNCTGELQHVLTSFESLLKPGGIVILVIIPKFCLWETLLFFKGKFKTATRRFFSSHGRKAHIEGVYFKCWYYNPRFVIKHLKKDFEAVRLEGLCTIVPPSYLENFAEKFPRLFRFLVKKEDALKASWPWKYMGDYFIISLKKKQ